MNSEAPIPNEGLRRARIQQGWSQAELAEQVGTSFEMVSRWERGISEPIPRYRKRLCVVLDKSAEELGLIRNLTEPFISPLVPPVLFACSHVDAEKAIVSHLKSALQERGIMLWSSRQFARQGTGNSRTALSEFARSAQAILIIVSPEARSSRHVRHAFEMARRHRRPVYGVWIEGEYWEYCLPENRVELAALIDAREKDTTLALEEVIRVLEQIKLASPDASEVAPLSLSELPLLASQQTGVPAEISSSINRSEQLAELTPPQLQVTGVSSPPSHSVEPTNGTRRVPPLPLPPTSPTTVHRINHSPIRVLLIVSAIILVITGSILGSFTLLTHFGVLGVHRSAATNIVIRGGTWTYGLPADIDSLIPNGTGIISSALVDQALYLPLFNGDAQGVIQPGAATVVPTVQNGGVSFDATTWTFHLRPHLVWSDGQPYDARDVDFTWRLWANAKFAAVNTLGLNLISSTEVSADHLAITFHLKHSFAPFLADLWVDGSQAPLPEHHFRTIAPETILKSPENLSPKVTSGPFMMSESSPGVHYMVVRNPHYYRFNQGQPYLDKVVFTVTNTTGGCDNATEACFLKSLQSGILDANGFIELSQDPKDFQNFQRLKNYTIVYPPTLNGFEAFYFNFHNTVLANHLEVRQAMAMAVNHQALITGPLHGFGELLCTDHPSAYHPGYEPFPPCPLFDLVAANKLLQDNGWIKGSDGVRTKEGQRLEFEYSTANVDEASNPARLDVEQILQHDFQQIGIKLDIQNYPGAIFFSSLLPQGKASPPTGAIAGRYDIAEFANTLGYDPDDSLLFSCNQFPPNGFNVNFYCNPALDALYTQEQTTADAGVRQQIFEQLHHIYLTQFPFIVLYSAKFFALARKGTHNYQQGPTTDTYNIAQWWCDNGKC